MGRLVSLILFAFFVSKLIDSVRKLNDDKIGMAISVKRYNLKMIVSISRGFCANCYPICSSDLVLYPSITLCVETDLDRLIYSL